MLGCWDVGIFVSSAVHRITGYFWNFDVLDSCDVGMIWLVFTVRRDDWMLGCWDFPYFDSLNIWILGFCEFYILMLQSVRCRVVGM